MRRQLRRMTNLAVSNPTKKDLNGVERRNAQPTNRERATLVSLGQSGEMEGCVIFERLGDVSEREIDGMHCIKLPMEPLPCIVAANRGEPGPPEKSDDLLPLQNHGLPLASREDSPVLTRGYLHVRNLDHRVGSNSRDNDTHIQSVFGTPV